MNIKLVTDKKIAETSSKGNQEKWLSEGVWYKLDQFGYESLSETLISRLLEKSNVESETPLTFVRYEIGKVNAHKRERICCKSVNFLKEGQELITINRLLSNELGRPLKEVLSRINSDKKRLMYLGEAVAEVTGLKEFGKYLSVLFEIDALFLNTDRHLNNIAVIYDNRKYDYCPIFDNGAGLLSDMITARTDIEPEAHIQIATSSPLGMSFTRQVKNVWNLFGKVFEIPQLKKDDIASQLEDLLEVYPERDRAIISDRVVTTILTMQKKLGKV